MSVEIEMNEVSKSFGKETVLKPKTILLASHLKEDLEGFCSQAYRIHGGEIPTI